MLFHGISRCPAAAAAGRLRQENLKKGIEACRRAAAMGADLALFPEMWNTGYAIPGTPQALRAAADAADGGFVRAFGALAGELHMAIGVTFLEAWEPAPRNSLTVFDRFGRRVLTYAKVHTCDFGDERLLTPGDGFETAELDTAAGPVRIGAMICYDREFPESARILMLQGAEILLVPNACPMELNRLSQLRARAYENMVGIATVNYPYGQPDCNGHSSAFDGIAYRPSAPGSDESGSRDMLVIEAGGQRGSTSPRSRWTRCAITAAARCTERLPPPRKIRPAPFGNGGSALPAGGRPALNRRPKKAQGGNFDGQSKTGGGTTPPDPGGAEAESGI